MESKSLQQIDPKRLAKERVRAEAERRGNFVRGMGSSLVGYGDGYKDGFEQAIAWVLGQLSDPLTADYRPNAGMDFIKRYCECRPKDRKSILEKFENSPPPAIPTTDKY